MGPGHAISDAVTLNLTLKLAPVQMAWKLGVEPNLLMGCFETG